MMKKILFLLLICVSQAKAQTDPDSVLLKVVASKPQLSTEERVRRFVIKAMINAIDFDKLVNAPKGFAHLSSVCVVFDKHGAIDTSIVSTRQSKFFELKKNPIAELKSLRPVLEYANCILVLPICYIREGETGIDLQDKFLKGFIDLFPQQFLNKRSNIILLKPEVNPFSQIK